MVLDYSKGKDLAEVKGLMNFIAGTPYTGAEIEKAQTWIAGCIGKVKDAKAQFGAVKFAYYDNGSGAHNLTLTTRDLK